MTLAPTLESHAGDRATPARPKAELEFETLLELGHGGMATAYLARTFGEGGFERLVVLKRLSQELARDPEAIARFLSEARVAARLHHANVIGTHQIGSDALGPFIVLDYVEGGSLDDLIDACRGLDERLPVGVVLRLALDVLAGLQAVHEATDGAGRPLAILHRDVSVENLLVGVQDGVARLADFGVARSTLGPGLTQPGFFVGKLSYFPPEYLLREPLGPELDIYALGVTLWLALTGEDLWPDESEGRIMRAIVEEGIPPLAGRREVAPEVAALVARACAKDPRQRFPSARAMAGVLEGFARRGWVASHGEVASLVEELLGKRLLERRALVARHSSGPQQRPTPVPASGARRKTRVDPRVLWLAGAITLIAVVPFVRALSQPAAAPPPTATVVAQITPAAHPALEPPPLASGPEVAPTANAPAAKSGAAPPGAHRSAPRRPESTTKPHASLETLPTAGGIRRENPYR